MDKDDSGIDSDNKPCSNESCPTNQIQMSPDNSPIINKESGSLKKKPVIGTSELQKKIEKQRDKNRRKDFIDEQPKKSFLLPRDRLNIPVKSSSASARSEQELPLVLLSDDSEEDEFAVGAPMSREAQREITQQLIKDGYNLDLEPDDEDLDLIPPRPLHERWACCPGATWTKPQCALM